MICELVKTVENVAVEKIIELAYMIYDTGNKTEKTEELKFIVILRRKKGTLKSKNTSLEVPQI